MFGQPAFGARHAQILARRRQQGKLSDQGFAPAAIDRVRERTRRFGFQSKLGGAHSVRKRNALILARWRRQLLPSLLQLVGLRALLQGGRLPLLVEREQGLCRQALFVGQRCQYRQSVRRAAQRDQRAALQEQPAWRQLAAVDPALQNFQRQPRLVLRQQVGGAVERRGQRVATGQRRLLRSRRVQITAPQRRFARGQSGYRGGFAVLGRLVEQCFGARVPAFVQGHQPIDQPVPRLRLRQAMPGGERQAQQRP